MGDGQSAPPARFAGGRLDATAPALPGVDVLSHLGHELRGPLNGIVGLVRIMLLKLSPGPADPAQQIHHLTLLQNSADQLTATVERVVELARIDTAPPIPAGELTDCRELVAAAEAQYRASPGDAPRLRAEVPDEPTFIPGTPDQLSSMLAELIDNAVRHAGATEIVLRVRPETAEAAAAIEIEDDGPGIPEADRERIFRPFERGDSTANQQSPGAGLGLCLATRRAARCGLRITLRNRPGNGSIFSIHRADPTGLPAT